MSNRQASLEESTSLPSERIAVPCVAINDILERVLSKHSEIDCLKIDVEGTEGETLSSIGSEFWSRIRRVYAENCNSQSFLPGNFRRSFRYNVERLERVCIINLFIDPNDLSAFWFLAFLAPVIH